MTVVATVLRLVYWPIVLAMAGVLFWFVVQLWGAPIETFGMTFLLLFGPATFMMLGAAAVWRSGRSPSTLLAAMTLGAGLWTLFILRLLVNE